jgi:hypothetical protein
MIKKIVIIALVLMAGALYIFGFKMKPTALTYPNVQQFTKDGFIDSMQLSNTNRLVSENNDFALYIDETTSYVKVYDKRSGQTWQSNPTETDPWANDPNKLLTVTATEKQRSTLELSYFNPTGTQVSINNYKMSIYHPQSILNPEGMRTFMIKYVDGGVQVLYQIKDLEIDHLFFPKFLPKDVFEAFPEFAVLSSIAYTQFNSDTQTYEILRYESMSRLVKQRLYDVFYGRLDYTREQAIEENMSYGYMESFEKPEFEVGIEIRLNEKGMEAKILHDSIKEPEDLKISNITLYPLFGTAVSIKNNQPTQGYLVVPDGSGAVIEFNNGKFYHNPYRKRVYGPDMTLMPYKMRESQESITVPLFGMIKETSGFAAIITEGEAMAVIHADVSNRIDSYNKIFASFNLRETEAITLGSGFNSYGINLWTKEKVKTDFKVEYVFLNGDDNNYAGVANAFRTHLLETYLISERDQTNQTVLTAEFIGAFDQKEFILGVPYYTNKSLTTFKEATIIIDELQNRGITDMNISYLGLFNGGLTSDLQNKLKVENVLGGKRGFNQFRDELSLNGLTLYAQVNISTTTSYSRMFDQFRYTATRLDGSLARDFTYHYPSRLPYSETPFEERADDYIINPRYYEAIYRGLSQSIHHDALSFMYLGSSLAGHYEKNQALYRQDAKNLQKSILENSNHQLMLSNPLSFAWAYSDYITDLPNGTTLYSIVDYPIPLLQLILSGFVDYSTRSMNMASERSITYNFLKAIETGSNLKYTLSYQDSKALIETNYNYYMSTHYVNWLDMIESQIHELNLLGIHEGRLIGHRRLQNNVYEVTYAHGLKIVINYNLNPVVINTRTIPSLGYLVWEV